MNSCDSRSAIAVVIALILGSAADIAAQTTPPSRLPAATITRAPRDGDDAISGTLPPSVVTNLIAVRIDVTDTATRQLEPVVDGQTFTVRLTQVLRAGQTVDVKYFTNGQWSDWSDVVYVQARSPSDLLYSYEDDDNPFEVSTFIAASLDQFASAESRSAAGIAVNSAQSNGAV